MPPLMLLAPPGPPRTRIHGAVGALVYAASNTPRSGATQVRHQGWCVPYEYNDRHQRLFTLPRKTRVRRSVDAGPSTVMVAEVQYGNKITDDLDRRLAVCEPVADRSNDETWICF